MMFAVLPLSTACISFEIIVCKTSDFTVAASVFHIQSMLKKQSHPVTVVKQPTENVGFLDNSLKQSTNTTFIDKKSYISKQ